MYMEQQNPSEQDLLAAIRRATIKRFKVIS